MKEAAGQAAVGVGEVFGLMTVTLMSKLYVNYLRNQPQPWDDVDSVEEAGEKLLESFLYAPVDEYFGTLPVERC